MFGFHPFGHHHEAVHSRLDLLEAEVTQMHLQKHMGQGMPSHQHPNQAFLTFHGPMGSPGSLGSTVSTVALPTRCASPAATPAPSMMTTTLPGSMPSPSNAGPMVPAEHYHQIMQLYSEAVGHLAKLTTKHNDLLVNHQQLMAAHYDVLTAMAQDGASGASGGKGEAASGKSKAPKMGVIRLDYDYPPAAGDTDSPASYGFSVIYRVVPGLTFEMAQAGVFTEAVERRFAEAIKYLEHKGVSSITGDCGFMMAFQVLARKIATVPVFMSSMVQCPVIGAAYDHKEQILILTANGTSLKPQKEVLLKSCGFHVDSERYVIHGCQDVPGFDAVAKGEAVPVELVQKGIIALTRKILQENPRIQGILLECTELPPYADALRATTGLAVWDAVTAADFYMSGFKDNPRFGVNDWQEEFNGEMAQYTFGQNLIEKDAALLVNKREVGTDVKADAVVKQRAIKAHAKAKAARKVRKLVKQQAVCLGVLRLDYNYPPAAGDTDCPGSYNYDVVFRMVPGLTFEMAQSGMMTYKVQQEFVKAIKWLEAKGVSGITGDCGFMMAFQPLARDVAKVPIFMSSMLQSPMLSVAFDKYDIILILTANSQTLQPQKQILLKECGFDVDSERFIIQGCQDVPGFDAVAKGEKVDVEKVTPGIVKLVMDLLSMQPNIRGILLECTELPPYADALRMTTGLPVWDAVTCADFFISSRKDNPRFGLNQWQNDWDGTHDDYKLGDNLTAEEKSHALNI